MINIMSIYLLSSLFGLYLNYFLDYLQIYSGDEGISYYSEAHLTKWNHFVHSLFMPITCYGLLLFIPNSLFLNRRNAVKFMKCLYLIYFFHYYTISVRISILFGVVFSIPTYFAIKYYEKSYWNLIRGFCIATTSLIIQEILGHQIGGDIPSRFEGVLNAIIYANYFALDFLNPRYNSINIK